MARITGSLHVERPLREAECAGGVVSGPGSSKKVDSATYHCGDFHIDAANRRFTCRGTEIPLEPKLFAVVLQLVARPGALITRHELLDAVWGHRHVTSSTLNRLIVLARRAFRDDPEEPRYIETVHGAGYRYIGPVRRAEPRQADQPARFVPPPFAQLPARIEALIGRERELDTLAQLLGDCRAVTVLGIGGIGKTECALECARRLTAEFPDGVWFFDLVPMKGGADWLCALATALAVPLADPAQMLDKILTLLQSRRALLLIDNCDRIATEVGALVIEILRGTHAVKVLATSQTPLQFVGEQLMRLPPLAVPDEEQTLGQIELAPAVEMLLTRIRSTQRAFTLTADNAKTIATICRRLDGIPLALELAAPRFSLLSADEVLQRLDDRFRLARSEVAGRNARHRSLSALLEWSFALLSSEEQQLLAWLGVFVQGWTVETAAELAAPLGHDAETVVELLTGLVNKSLVSVTHGLNPTRYHLLETVREYALERLRLAGAEQQARDAHLALMVRMSETAHRDMVGGRMSERIGRLVHENGNISSALEHALRTEENRTAAVAIVGSLMFYVKARGIYGLGLQWCLRVLAEPGLRDTVERGRAMLCLGVTAVHRLATTRDEPERYLREAIRIASLRGDSWSEGYASGYYALWLANWGQPAEAAEYVAATERAAELLNDPILHGLVGLAHGFVEIAKENPAAAIDSLRSVRDLGSDLHQRQFIDTYIGLALFSQRNYAAAAHQWVAAMHGWAEVGNIRGVAGCIEGCGYVAEKHGQWSDAARFLGLAQELRDKTSIALFNFWLAYHEAAHAELRSQLGEAEYRRCSSAGAAMQPEEGVSYAQLWLRQSAEGAPPTGKPRAQLHRH